MTSRRLEWQGELDELDEDDEAVSVIDREEVINKPPPLYKVMLLNDDFTPVSFVEEMLKMFFYKTNQEAAAITRLVHEQGKGIAGIYTYDIATTKATIVENYARQHGHPLKIITEAE